MLIQSRTRYSGKKLNSSITTPMRPILPSNPQIQLLSDQLLLISSSLPEQRPSSLNLIHWEKEKYRPSQNQNRIRIENQISLIKVCNERVRSRVKPVRRALSIESCHHTPQPYKQHYEQIRASLARKISSSDAAESQQQPQIPLTAPSAPHSSIKYLHDLRKYTKIVQFINQRMEQRSHSVQIGLTTAQSQQLSTKSPEKRPLVKHHSTVYKEMRFQGQLQKASSIVRKWKPASKAQRIFSKTTEIKPRAITAETRQRKAQRQMKTVMAMTHSNSLTEQTQTTPDM